VNSRAYHCVCECLVRRAIASGYDKRARDAAVIRARAGERVHAKRGRRNATEAASKNCKGDTDRKRKNQSSNSTEKRTDIINIAATER
jgi:hypothetical protein